MKGLAILAKQRTGTNFLRSIIENSTSSIVIGEIFHTETISDKGNFYGWMRERNISVPAIRSREWLIDIFSSYFEYIDGFDGPVVIDIKYNSIHSLSHSWLDLVNRPVLINIIMNRRWPIVHLERLDRIARTMSAAIAHTTGQYIKRDMEFHSSAVYVDPNLVRHLHSGYETEIALVSRYLDGYGLARRVSYERLTDALRERDIQFFKEMVKGSDIHFHSVRDPKVYKLVPDWKKIVKNLSELEDIFKDIES